MELKKLVNQNPKLRIFNNFGCDLTRQPKKAALTLSLAEKDSNQSPKFQPQERIIPILIGEPGVGKSAIAEGLALRIVQRRVSRALFNKRVFTLDSLLCCRNKSIADSSKKE